MSFKKYLLLLCLTIPTTTFAEVHQDKKVQLIHSADGRPCMFFLLEGVSEAGSITPGVPWFSLSLNHHAEKEIFSMLLAAKTAGGTVTVVTTGNLLCGHAEVSHVIY